MSSIVGSTIGRYRVTGVLAAGGMGEVYRGEDNQTGRTVAIKTVRSELHDQQFLSRFRNEARIHARLYHPNIATLYETVETARGPCLVMEYVPGPTLADWLDQNGPLAWNDALRTFCEIARAVAYLHANDVVHRDLKPQNIKLMPDRRVKLLDFGIAKDMSSLAYTSTGIWVGTLRYLSPEQATGTAADARSDVWAMGVVFHELLTGCTPFPAHSLEELLRQINAGYGGLRSSDLGLPEECEALLRCCLKRRPGQRFRDARKIAGRLESMMASAKTEESAAPPKPPRPFFPAILAQGSRGRQSLLLAAGTLPLAIVLLLGRGPVTPPPGVTIPPLLPRIGQPDLAPRPAESSVSIGTLSGPISIYNGKALLGIADTKPVVLTGRVGTEMELRLERKGEAQRYIKLRFYEVSRRHDF
jgi:serine/threonine protein kinase